MTYPIIYAIVSGLKAQAMKYYKLLLFLSVIFSLIFPLKSYAETNCQLMFGGGQNCVTTSDLSINKTVLNPQTKQFVENLNINDPKYQPSFLVTFKISVTNHSTATMAKINVKDIFPQYVNFSSGDGVFDSKTKTLSFNITNLKSQETKTFTVIGKVVASEQISTNQGSGVCVINQATATADNQNKSQDNTQFCIDKKAPQQNQTTIPNTSLPAKQLIITPATGPESLALFSLIPIGLTGLFLRRKSEISRN